MGSSSCLVPAWGVFCAALLPFGLAAQAQTLAAAAERSPPDAVKSILLPFLMPDDFEDMDMVAWRVEQGRPDPNNPLIEPKTPWDEGAVMSTGTILHDTIDGRWKASQFSTPISKPGQKNPN